MTIKNPRVADLLQLSFGENYLTLLLDKRGTSANEEFRQTVDDVSLLVRCDYEKGE